MVKKNAQEGKPAKRPMVKLMCASLEPDQIRTARSAGFLAGRQNSCVIL
jgi:hypothetical protein